jgi:hypothetical protein
MTVVAFDLETHLIRPGLLAPKMVCLSRTTETSVELEDREQGLAWFRKAIVDPHLCLVGHNVYYDLGVLCAEDPSLVPLVFDAIDRERIRDTLTRERLLDLAKGQLVSERVKGHYSLASIARRRLAVELDKGEDSWRLRYAELDSTPIAWWPEAARKYACDDATTTLRIYDDQDKEAGEPIPDEIPQVRAAWALHLLSMWGVRTDAKAVARLRQEMEVERDAVWADAKAAGLVRADGTRDTKAMQARLVSIWNTEDLGPLPRTAQRGPSLAGEVLERSGDALLVRMSEADHAVKQLGTYVPKLEMATKRPLCPRYTAMLETGRTSATDNAQTPPRKGGVRGCFVSREGYVYGSVDYDSAEMRSWAQACLDLVKHSKLALRYQADPAFDPHCLMASILMGISEADMLRRYAAGDEDAAEHRQLSKPADFGFPGGMGEEAFVAYAAGYGIRITLLRSREAKGAWRQAWPEERDYFRYVSATVGPSGEARSIRQLRSGRVRGRVPYCAVANGFFQGLVADGAKRALWLVSRECYTGVRPDGKPSPLAGSRPVMFLHDEIIAEMPEARASDAAERMAEVMIGAMREFCPDVPILAKPVLMRRWQKGAKQRRDQSGRLVPVEDAVDVDGLVAKVRSAAVEIRK